MSSLSPSAAAPAPNGGDVRSPKRRPSPAPSPDPGALEPGPERMRAAYQSADWRTVEVLAAAHLDAQPEDREVAQMRARALNQLKDWDAAAAAWSRVADLRPDWWEASYQLARARLRAGDVLAALEAAGRLSAQSGTGEDARLAEGHLLVEIGRLRDARGAFAALATSDRARLDREVGAWKERDALREVAVALSALAGDTAGPDAAEADAASERLLRRGIGHERAGRALDALLDFEAALLVLPGDRLAERSAERVGRALLERAQVHLRSGDLPEARRTFGLVLRAAPSDPKLLHALGRLLSAAGEWAPAAEGWRLFLRARPGDLYGAVQRARALENAGRLAEAIAAWEAVRAAEPANAEAEHSLSRMPHRLIKAGREAVAERRLLDAWRALSAVPPDAPEREDALRRLDQVGRYLLQAMRAAYKERRFHAVVRDGAAAAAILPDNPDVHNLLARAATKLHRHPVALRAWEELNRLRSGSDDAVLVQIARCHLHMDEVPAGRAVLAAVLARNPRREDAQQLEIDFRERLLFA